MSALHSKTLLGGSCASGGQATRRNSLRPTSACLAMAMLTLAMFLGAGVARAHGKVPSEGTKPPVRQLHTRYCSDALFQLLPGKSDYCAAVNHLARGDWSAGIDMMKRSAAWASKSAQRFLGVAYFNGEHVPRNRPLGLAWLALASEREADKPLQLFASAYEQTSKAEHVRAQHLLNSMRSKYGDKYAAKRADQHYQRRLRKLAGELLLGGRPGNITTRDPRVLSSNAIGGSQVCFKAYVTDPQDGQVRPWCVNPNPNHRGRDPMYAKYFNGWKGHVLVGGVETVKSKKGEDAEN